MLEDIEEGSQRLIELVAASDGLQLTADRRRNIRHFANTMFNIMRGGIFDENYTIERADFMEEPPKKFFRLAPGREVRLRYAYYVTCIDVIKDARGNVTELRCNYDPATKGGNSSDGRKVKATLHWVSAAHAVAAF